MHRRASVCAAIVCFAVIAPLAAQSKQEKCANIQVDVDVKERGASKWTNGAYVLRLGEKGEGWRISEPAEMAGGDITLPKGSELRLNFNDGANHPVSVSASTGGGKALSVEGGSTEAIVKVSLKAETRDNPGAIAFEIEGAKNPKAKIGACTGGRIYVRVE